ncbi:MAG: penicillin acylase family protein [Chloroflexota bacterium]
MNVDGLDGRVLVRRDAYGIPHIEAGSEGDAWLGLGFCAAQDRLWQMEFDRRRATGRWSEVVGAGAVGADTLSRRLRLADSARLDLDAMSAETRASFEAYAKGVNAYLRSGLPLPPEYGMLGLEPEPWQPWHGVAAFKIRHVLMGAWQHKLAEAMLLVRAGPDAFRKLEPRPPVGSVVAVPPGARLKRLYRQAERDLDAAARQLGFLAEVEAGSNAWVVHGSRTSTGLPILCGDSHRALDVPNVYWQAHLRCPQFDVIGATFPGLPGFPHFGHNGNVGWVITHAQADYQDLYIEQFDAGSPPRYRLPAGWAEADVRQEEIQVRGAEPRTIETWATRHGAVVHGDPRAGWALSLRYTATDGACRGLEPLRPMLRSRTVHELLESQREWVDPVNNLVAADIHGNIAYLTRGMVPVRATTAGAQLPVPGWTDAHEWLGMIPFEEMPRLVNPPRGFIATANQAILTSGEPYISYTFAVPFRAERIVERLQSSAQWTPQGLAAMQADVLSTAARHWGRRLRDVGPFHGNAERARGLLSDFDGQLNGDSPAAYLYGWFRRALARGICEPLVGTETWRWLAGATLPPTTVMVGRWLASRILNGDVPPETVEQALEHAWTAATDLAGGNPSLWRWEAHHGTNARHSLAGIFPEEAERLNPPVVEMGGDADTIQAASFGWAEAGPFPVTGLSVYRQVLDLAKLGASSFVIPGGASGVPGHRHYQDQLALWRTHQRVPMTYDADRVDEVCEERLDLDPA